MYVGSRGSKPLLAHTRWPRDVWGVLLDFGSLLKKLLFLGRTLLLRLQGYQTCVGAGMLASGLANAVLAQHFVLGGLPTFLPISVAY